MTALVSVEDSRTALEEMLARRNPAPPPMPPNYLDDYAKIYSLMTDKERCVAQLTMLNTILVMAAERENLRRPNFLGIKKRELVKEKFIYTLQSDPTKTVSAQFRKHGKILKTYLDDWERIWGFNATGQQ